jgi:hypothetical protein
MAAKEWLYVVKESALGTPKTAPTAGVDSCYIRLVEGNAFGMEPEPVQEEIPYGGGLAITADTVSDHYAVKGTLKTKLYPAQALMLLGWGLTRINSGQTLPWVTTEVPGDLPSCSLVHAVRRSDGSYRYRQFAGTKVSGLKIDVSRQGTSATLTLDLMACQCYGNAMDATADPTIGTYSVGPPLVVPAPADADYPTGPYTFKMTGGVVSVGGSVRTQYEDLAFSAQNTLDGRWFELSHLSVNQFCGRSVSLDANLYLKATPDDRSAFEAITAQACSVGFSNGVTGQNLTINLQAQNRIKSLPYDLPLDKVFMTKLSLRSQYDLAAGTDLAVSFV